MDYEKEISFGAFDSELMHQEITIPKGFEAIINGNKIILKKIEIDDEKVKRILHSISSKISFHLCDIFTEEEFQCFDTWSNAWLKKQSKQNLVEWSEKDDMMIKETLYFLREYQQSNRCKDENGMQNSVTCEKWLKSIKNRVISQPKQEWSEEDEKILNEIFSVAARASLRKSTLFGKSYDYIKWQNWLKSLKDRYTWKPSDEQMKSFEHFVRSIGESGYASPYENNIKLLYSLLNDLKKLIK